MTRSTPWNRLPLCLERDTTSKSLVHWNQLHSPSLSSHLLVDVKNLRNRTFTTINKGECIVTGFIQCIGRIEVWLPFIWEITRPFLSLKVIQRLIISTDGMSVLQDNSSRVSSFLDSHTLILSNPPSKNFLRRRNSYFSSTENFFPLSFKVRLPWCTWFHTYITVLIVSNCRRLSSHLSPCLLTATYIGRVSGSSRGNLLPYYLIFVPNVIKGMFLYSLKLW